jgi:glycosyltransferase involved in cell wall biosynthesis
MEPSPASNRPIVVLLGNYPPDRQESMLRFHDLMKDRLRADGYTVESIAPRGVVGPLAPKGGAAKWLGYVDKYIVFTLELLGIVSRLREKYLGRKIVVHICDHSNAVYASKLRRWFPVVVTCHDLLAVRGALGEDTDCPASGFGKLLQREILNGLKHATEVVCVSKATQADLIRLGGAEIARHSEVIPLALNYSYGAMSQDEAMDVLKHSGIELEYRGYVLHVGSAAKRKNREALLHSVARIKDTWPGRIVFAGEPLTATEREQAQSLGLGDRIREIPSPDNATLHALYGAAHGLIFMSTAEGFGWPILEAQVSECPVICSNRTSVPEIAGEGALVHEPQAYAAIAADIVRLQNPAFRASVVAAGLKNVRDYSSERMMRGYEDVYRRI